MSARLLMSTAMLLVLTGVAAAQQQPSDPAAPAEQVQQVPPAEGGQAQPGQSAAGEQAEQAQDQPQEELEQQTEQAEKALDQQQEQPSEQAEEQPAEGEDPATQQAEEQPAEAEEQQTAAAGAVDFIKMQEEGQTRAEELIGFDVITSDDEDVGEVKDLILDQDNKITGVVLSVGGFLGIGEKSVALPYDAVQVEEDAIRVNIDSGTLEEAPAFATLEEVKAAEQAQQAQMQQQQQLQQAAPTAAPAAPATSQ